MKLQNLTPYDTRALRRLIVAMYHQIAEVEGAASWWPHLRIRAKLGRAHSAHGRAYLNGGPITLILPRPERTETRAQGEVVEEEGRRVWKRTGPDQRVRVPGAPPMARVAYVVGHELMHAYGYSHGEFGDEPEFFPVPPSVQDIGPTLPVRVLRPKPPVDRAQVRYARVLELEKKWTRKARLAATKLRKLRAARRRYERLSMAASPRGSADT